MTEIQFQNVLRDLLRDVALDADLSDSSDPDPSEILNVSTFDDAGLMTRNAGLVVQLDDGSEFQLRIVRSS
jgi:hypothetical protein